MRLECDDLDRSVYVNRIRASKWIQLHEAAGFKVVSWSVESNDGVRTAFDAGRLPYLEKYSETDRFSQILDIVLRK